MNGDTTTYFFAINTPSIGDTKSRYKLILIFEPQAYYYEIRKLNLPSIQLNIVALLKAFILSFL